jgi:hypothetical protein
MNKLNLTKPVNGLDGKAIKDGEEELKISKVLANALAQSNQLEPIKFFDWAVRLFNDGVLEVDDTDLELIVNFVKSNKGLSVLVSGQILKALKNKETVETQKI